MGEASFLRAEWRAMQRRIVAHLKARTSDLAEDVLAVPAQVYSDPARCEAERRALFLEQPLLAGFSGEVPEPGDRLLFDAAGPPLLIVRGRDRSLRAFLNLCTHRGSRLVSGCERTPRLTCPFHAWSFDLEGQLAGTPVPGAFEGVDREARQLVRVPVAEWSGMIFVRAKPGGAEIDVEAFLGPMAPLLRALELGALQRVKADELRLPSNWKLALDTFCETYHVPALHRSSLARNLYAYVELFDHYGRHHRYSGPGLDFAALVGKPEAEWPELHYQAVHYLFPNTTVAFTHGLDGRTPVVAVFRLFPGASVGETITLASTYRRSDAPGVSDAEIAAMHDSVLAIVSQEDYRVVRQAWQGIVHAPAGFRFVFGRSEALPQAYHRDIAEAIGMPFA